MNTPAIINVKESNQYIVDGVNPMEIVKENFKKLFSK